ncbi:hypothetical protein DUI87_35267 [Hirundo rustica rustica]|uniref:Uncharacterized protein n=1 Tax=Hirundo rustica rustica TaxID=333673 RepID=A0A3M0IN16_HIRRU|nr:hypothetical protein DUI87_35267 [Hirundo rustica rustica]
MANPEQRPIGDVSVPLNTGDVREFKKEMGRLLEDPIGVAERLDPFLGPNIYTYVELQSILGILFTMEERERLDIQELGFGIENVRGQTRGIRNGLCKIQVGIIRMKDTGRIRGEDLIIALRIKIAPCERKLKIYSLTEEDNFKIRDTVWYTGEVRKLNLQPISTEIQNPEIPIRVKQYPIALEGQKRLKPVAENSVHQGVLESCVSPQNTPILPVKKPDGSYRLVQDLRAVNQRTITRFPGVAKPDTS